MKYHTIFIDGKKGAAPEWIELLPPALEINGYDGRNWRNDNPDQLVAKFTARKKPMVVDYEHASEHRAPQGLEAPAAGWIDQLEIRAGGIWAHVKWTERAAELIKRNEYRFVSPVFNYEKTTRNIVDILSVGLTNQPNLGLTALNQRLLEPLTLFPQQREIAKRFGMTDEAFSRALQAELETAQNDNRLTPIQREVCQRMGLSPADYINNLF